MKYKAKPCVRACAIAISPHDGFDLVAVWEKDF